MSLQVSYGLSVGETPVNEVMGMHVVLKDIDCQVVLLSCGWVVFS